MNYSKEQLIDALVHEWDYLCHDDYDPQDPTPEEYRKEMESLTIEELIEETSTGEGYTLDEFMENHCNILLQLVKVSQGFGTDLKIVYVKRVKAIHPCLSLKSRF